MFLPEIEDGSTSSQVRGTTQANMGTEVRGRNSEIKVQNIPKQSCRVVGSNPTSRTNSLPQKEKQPSQEPKDDNEELGPCGFLVCDDRKVTGFVACECCELNPTTYDEVEYDDP